MLPTASEYSQAIQNLHVTAADEELKGGKPVTDPLGIPLQYSGNFAVVFQVRCPATGNTWAVKCFTKEVQQRGRRYEIISRHLKEARLPFMTEFEYQETGILAAGRWNPIVKMRWIEGDTLNQFVDAHLEKPVVLRKLLQLWVKLAERLEAAEITHADLQHGNVLLVPATEREGHRLMLVDYDGIYLPALAGEPSGELGHPAYQHPQRLREEIYSAEVDRFSHLAIYCAIQCLIAGGRELWARFDNEDNLLFRKEDFADPRNSKLLHELWEVGDPKVHTLVGRLVLATQQPLTAVPELQQLYWDGNLLGLRRDEERQVAALLDGAGKVLGVGVRSADELRSLDTHRAAEGFPGSSEQPKARSGEDSSRREAGPDVGEYSLSLEGPPPQIRLLERIEQQTGLAPTATVILSLVGVFALALVGFALVGLFGSGTAVPGPQAVASASTTPAKQVSATVADADELARVITNSIRMKLVLIPAGEFLMGSPDSDSDASGDERPQHRVRITRPFYLGATEVTQAEYERVMETNPSSFRGDPQRPVETVSWDDAVEFCRRLSALESRQYRLPTEAEWEYACRAGSTARWCFGENESELTDYGWYSSNSTGTTHAVGQKRPNVWGLYDMHGNVWEWCGDWYDRAYYASSPMDDPTGPTTGSSRVYRGGSWGLGAGRCRAGFRYDYGPGIGGSYLGFRVSLVPAENMAAAKEASKATGPVITSDGGQASASKEIPENTTAVTRVTASAGEDGSHGLAYRIVGGDDASKFAIDRATGALIFTTAPDYERPVDADGNNVYELTVELAEVNGAAATQRIQITVTDADESPAVAAGPVLTNSIDMKLVLIPAGEFLMGSPDSDSDASGDERPQHRVRISRPFYLGATEVTQAEYEGVMGTNPSSFQGDRQRPVESVSWDSAVEFCRRLSQRERREYHLPTEAEWEYACRAGSRTRYCFGESESELTNYAWYDFNSDRTTHAVGQKRPNVWGLYDMHGNVWEWCGDWYDRAYYASSPMDDPTGSDGGSNRVYRGGSWNDVARRCRAGARSIDRPGFGIYDLGFRVSLVPAE